MHTSTSGGATEPMKPPVTSPGSSLTLTPPPPVPRPPPPPLPPMTPPLLPGLPPLAPSLLLLAARAPDPGPILWSMLPPPAAGRPLAAACALRRDVPPASGARFGDVGDEGPADTGAAAPGRSAAGSSSAGTLLHCGSGWSLRMAHKAASVH